MFSKSIGVLPWKCFAITPTPWIPSTHKLVPLPNCPISVHACVFLESQKQETGKTSHWSHLAQYKKKNSGIISTASLIACYWLNTSSVGEPTTSLLHCFHSRSSSSINPAEMFSLKSFPHWILAFYPQEQWRTHPSSTLEAQQNGRQPLCLYIRFLLWVKH